MAPKKKSKIEIERKEEGLFPPIARIRYQRAPLLQVVAQLRFPPLLRIQSEAPADFQDRIRATFPLLERGPATQAGQQIPAEVLQVLMAGAGDATYRFLTEDRKCVITLSPDAISLTADRYTQWEDFKAKLGEPLRALVDIYRPGYFSRVGLRFVNAISREELGLSTCPWSELLRPELLGELSNPAFEQCLDSTRRILRLKYPNGNGGINFQHGTALLKGQPEQRYTIDFDFYSGPKTEVTDAEPLLDEFNDRAFSAFRWCISDKLHRALDPTRLAIE